MSDLRILLPDAEATGDLGHAIGCAAPTGLVIAAVGQLGAGKTCLAQGVARGLDVPTGHYVNSPTFAILQSHPGRLVFHHIDLYRIGDSDEALGVGLDEVVGAEGVTLVEWPGRLPELLPADVLWIHLEVSGAGRTARIAATGEIARGVLRTIEPAFG